MFTRIIVRGLFGLGAYMNFVKPMSGGGDRRLRLVMELRFCGGATREEVSGSSTNAVLKGVSNF